MAKIYCKHKLRGSWQRYQCTREAVRDGYCKWHESDIIMVQQQAAYDQSKIKRKRSPWYRLEEAQKKIKEQEKEIGRLKAIIGEHYVGT